MLQMLCKNVTIAIHFFHESSFKNGRYTGITYMNTVFIVYIKVSEHCLCMKVSVSVKAVMVFNKPTHHECFLILLALVLEGAFHEELQRLLQAAVVSAGELLLSLSMQFHPLSQQLPVEGERLLDRRRVLDLRQCHHRVVQTRNAPAPNCIHVRRRQVPQHWRGYRKCMGKCFPYILNILFNTFRYIFYNLLTKTTVLVGKGRSHAPTCDILPHFPASHQHTLV